MDTDECTERDQKCFSNEKCVNSEGTYSCVCKQGYTKIGDLCEDIDECKNEEHSCWLNSYCQNNDGSYECLCGTGPG